ncbi:general secretion pathway protein GspF [Oceanicoccus sp. KOV_DT_Chl]|uniref:general secretion pathway protein GspF n=1 Tax=Oceanicoccus sp. KOV_DT_Chl TaxID=1904639 RepID=UPI001F2F922B|nr:general secretion pathway protein GspF [Oceanicoccus sp. KOV_DT_Chl]
MTRSMKPKTHYGLNEALLHPDHSKPKSRRDFLAQGFKLGGATMLGVSINSLLSSRAHALSSNLLTDPDSYTPTGTCDLNPAAGGRKIPFICFDLAGGANISGSNVLVGGPGGQLDLLSAGGYQKLGLPADLNPNPSSAADTFIDDSLGLLFHSESAMLSGIKEKCSAATMAATNGAVIPSRSDNDTGNNPHNPMYGIYDAQARGGLVQLIGSEVSASGGNSMAPNSYMALYPDIRPTKISSPSDAAGLVDVGSLNSLFADSADTLAVMESMKRITDYKLGISDTLMTNDEALKQRLSCEYLRSADTYEKFDSPDKIDPSKDPLIVGASGIFGVDEFNGDREFRKAASVMKLVIDGHAAAGTIEMGGYDYHTGDRNTGEGRDLRAGRCIGACIEYAMRRRTPLMLYVFSDGSVASDGSIERMAGLGQGKCVWSGDNSSTGSAFFLVIDPDGGRPSLLDMGPNGADDPLTHQQIGWMRDDASVETSATPAANNVNMLVETVILNYMALHGEEGSFAADRGLGSETNNRRYRAFTQLASVSGGIINPPPIT